MALSFMAALRDLGMLGLDTSRDFQYRAPAGGARLPAEQLAFVQSTEAA
jgi:hypothetical protein